ncbi:MAG: Protein-L-isoaspartate O-methyltransferase [uncultured Sphingomonas sp.]|uniref:Protein-L-isoaspartate O-methyltransferase n=1 Tax=uncultured Sphingomonas sp. TaxID=158754 RepID=A0A6J4TH86_9SPHN|nr:MAG: Protein-L-isoaspartate O-methyltransferase [uncultured Sphingomonas sp.]
MQKKRCLSYASLARAGLGCAAALLLPGCQETDHVRSPAAPTRSLAQADTAIPVIQARAVPLRSTHGDHDRLIASIGGATRVLLGESTHGTAEFYRERGRITLRLVREAGIRGVAIEGDWSPTYRVNLYVRGLGADRNARQALRGFTRFPFWMWPNAEFAELVEQLRAHNAALPANERVGVYGMDVYDLYDAADFVVEHLRGIAPEAARRARTRYRCFAAYGRNTHTYGVAAQQAPRSCRDEAQAVAAEVARLPRPANPTQAEAHFAANRAAASVAAAEEYFRTVYTGANAWNVRDRRMEANVEAIAEHLGRLTNRPAKLVMWSHNTHSGDARATFAAQQGELNLGQLMKQRHGNGAYLVGFFTHSGTVLAAPAWDERGRVYDLRPALPNSYSGLFHRTGLPAFTLPLRDDPQLRAVLSTPMLERAVGVVYVRDRERTAHYFPATLSQQFDAAIFLDRTTAVKPL